MKSILIVRLSAIGDVIHTLPCLEMLRRRFPEARIGWIVEQLSAPLLEGHSDIDKLYVIPKKRWRGRWIRVWRSEVFPFFRAIRADGWDASIDFQGLTKSGLAAWASGARQRFGFSGGNAREINFLFTNRGVVPDGRARHVVEHNLSLLWGMGATPLRPDEAVPYGRLPIRDDEIAWARGLFAEWGLEWGRGAAALNPGAGWPTKRWPVARFIAVGEQIHARLGLCPVVVWGPGEETMRDEIAAGLSARGVEARVAPPTTLRQLAALSGGAALFVGGDTGPTHMAAMQGVPTVAVFGASDGRRNAPWGPRVAVAQSQDLICVPCWKTRCRISRPDTRTIPCLQRVTAESVAQAAADLMASQT